MYKSAHDIPIYNFTQCELGDLSYLGRGIFKRRRFKKIKGELAELQQADKAVVTSAVQLNWVSTMEILARTVNAMAFATEEQKQRVEAIVSKLGMTLKPDDNARILSEYKDWVLSTLPTESGEAESEKKSPLHLLVGHLTYISLTLQGVGRLDPKRVSVVEFLELTELANKQTENLKKQKDNGR